MYYYIILIKLFRSHNNWVLFSANLICQIWTNFFEIGIRERFKLCKSKNYNWRSKIIDPHQNSPSCSVQTISAWARLSTVAETFSDGSAKVGGLRPIREWMVSTLSDRPPGLFILFGVFSVSEQLHWVGRCLFEYAEPPNVTNLSSIGTYTGSDVFRACGADKLRWATLGNDYNWTSKEYSTKVRPLPMELRRISQLITDALGLGPFVPDAAIVNYYPKGATLSPHVDRSERDLSRPLLSFSFGQSAVYLSGGLSLDGPVDALLLRSGDVLVMSGQQRLVYHAVPKILSGETSFDNVGDVSLEGAETDEVVQYANRCRVNVTVRQVNAENLEKEGALMGEKDTQK